MSEYKFIITSGINTGYYNVQISQSGATITTSPNTFGNCQMFTIGYFNNFLNYIPQGDWLKRLMEVKMLAGSQKPLLMVDINRHYVKQIKESGLKIVRLMHYTSSNWSKMSVLVIELKR